MGMLCHAEPAFCTVDPFRSVQFQASWIYKAFLHHLTSYGLSRVVTQFGEGWRQQLIKVWKPNCLICFELLDSSDCFRCEPGLALSEQMGFMAPWMRKSRLREGRFAKTGAGLVPGFSEPLVESGSRVGSSWSKGWWKCKNTPKTPPRGGWGPSGGGQSSASSVPVVDYY